LVQRPELTQLQQTPLIPFTWQAIQPA